MRTATRPWADYGDEDAERSRWADALTVSLVGWYSAEQYDRNGGKAVTIALVLMLLRLVFRGGGSK